ncbi:hypothetical protein RND71_038960 [Anisodus tanguticus]|uniref:APO domain-containing protein n=1 Tax=Anisodus tanguticus TaxID=243964 RepID=A0AAE1R1P9_9SOLA|nr:hypothetical protein RND71_038960 [Anisodus tanguticus]
MFHRRVGSVLNLRLESWVNLKSSWQCNNSTVKENVVSLYSSATALEALPRKLKRAEKKLWVTNINELKRRGRLDKQERRMVLASRGHILACVSRISEEIPIYFCSFCSEVHVGHPPHKIRTCNVSGSQKNKEHTWQRGSAEHVLPVVESFHLYDRLGRAVSHDERLEVDRIPALVELYFEKFPKDDLSGKDVETSKSREIIKKLSGDGKYLNLPYDDIKGFAMRGLEAWNIMRTGSIQLMQTYGVQTCGYCPEVQVGPKGHRVRQCQAFKHQMRDGQHGWQESTIDDFLSTVYVWHGRNPHDGELLVDSLKRYFKGRGEATLESGCCFVGLIGASEDNPRLYHCECSFVVRVIWQLELQLHVEIQPFFFLQLDNV